MLALILALAVQAPLQAPEAKTVSSPRLAQSPEQRDALRAYLREEESKTYDSILGGNFSVGPIGGQLSVSPFPAPGVFSIEIEGTGTGWTEYLLLGVPNPPPTTPVPLLVMFHGYKRTEANCYDDGNDTFQGALNRGWYVIAPRGAHKYNYGIHYAQANIEYVLSLYCEQLNVDMDRIYGVGFSMGGGGVMSYAARHLDPGKPRMAAVVNHTGGVSTANVYWNTTDTVFFDHPENFGDSPAVVPFLYSQASCVDIGLSPFVVDPATDLARNLATTPVLNYHADFDPKVNLVAMTQTIYSWLSLIPGMETHLLTPPHSIHHWSTLDENTALNYLASKTLQTPNTGQHRVLADREAKWFHFYVYQDVAMAFTPFRWDFDAQANRLVIDETENLQRVVVDTLSLGIDTAQDLEVIMQTSDGSTEVTTLRGYSQQPTTVLRNGLPTSNWSWDGVGEAVTLTEIAPLAGALWVVRP